MEHLNPKHYAFINGLLQGKSQMQAYMDAGFTQNSKAARNNASELRRNPLVDEELRRRQNEIDEANKEMLKSSQCKAIEKMIKLLSSLDEYIVFKASADIMDRTGLKPKDVVDMNIDQTETTIILRPASEDPALLEKKAE